MKNTLLWLDDVRNPFIEYDDIENSYNVVWVKSFDEFYEWIKEYGLPDDVSFDHDLGGEKDGCDAAKVLCEFCMNMNWATLPKWYIHSANPVGRERITSILKSYEKAKFIAEKS